MSNEDCVICKESISKDWGKLECHHKFHFECIEKWLKYKSCCPLCRKETNEIINIKNEVVVVEKKPEEIRNYEELISLLNNINQYASDSPGFWNETDEIINVENEVIVIEKKSEEILRHEELRAVFSQEVIGACRFHRNQNDPNVIRVTAKLNPIFLLDGETFSAEIEHCVNNIENNRAMEKKKKKHIDRKRDFRERREKSKKFRRNNNTRRKYFNKHRKRHFQF